MNNKRRQAIRMIIRELNKASPDIDYILGELQAIIDDETYAMDNVPESLQESERYIIMEESVELLEDAIDVIDPDDASSFLAAAETLTHIDGV